MAERVYAAVGFRDLGRILEYVPQENLAKRCNTSSASVTEGG